MRSSVASHDHDRMHAGPHRVRRGNGRHDPSGTAFGGGTPGNKWVGADGVECWRYGARHVFLQNDRVTKIAFRERYFNSANLIIGLPEAAVISLRGRRERIGKKRCQISCVQEQNA